MSRFSIRKIVVHDTCDKRILKILKPDEYVFTDIKYDDFFLKGVTICSVVGKNGCGKSSLIELLFRVINNLGAMMLRNFDRPAAEVLYFIDGVVADLYYVIDGTEGTLCCDKNSVTLTHGEYLFQWKKNEERCIYRINGSVQIDGDYSVALSVANHFFYLIATNYSMQAYIDADYRKDVISLWRIKQNNKGHEWHREETGCWINSVFHKNDGYMCPIVLNPYRDNGKIDMARESRLTTNRLCALLLQTQNEKYEIIEGYRLDHISYKFNQSYLLSKFDRQMLRDIPVEKVSEKFLYVYLLENSFAKAVLDGYKIDATKQMNYIELTLRLYLVYKSFSIAKKYPQYSHYKSIGHVNNAFKSNPNEKVLDLAKELAEKINNAHTHIELKIHQTLDLISQLDKTENNDSLEKTVTYEEFNVILGKEPNCNSVIDRMNTLPPPLFEPTIFLRRLDTGKVVALSDLSSGERQFIFTTSTLLYHSFNILSIPQKGRVAYRNICMVLDEVEICFHPEYQRTFVNSLLTLLERTQLNQEFGINVIIVTHSPFVLSDLPKGNILYLENGENVTSKKKLNTFGANVNELLCQSFFLSGGFMGEFAKKKIESLASSLQNENQDGIWGEKSARELIEVVGDEVIQYQLQQMFSTKFKNSEEYRNWIEKEARRLGIKE